MIEVEATQAPENSRCAAHPDENALFICDRCGDFCCEKCLAATSEGAVCSRCGLLTFEAVDWTDRVAAGATDYAFPIVLPLLGPFAAAAFGSGSGGAIVSVVGTVIALGILLANVAITFLGGSTVGRKQRAIEVVRSDGTPPRLLQRIARAGMLGVLLPLAWFSKLAAFLFVLLNVTAMIVSRRSFVDRISGTKVVKSKGES